jgi:hypothetical protein
MRKSTVVILNQLNIKNNKINKDNFEKNHNKKKILWGNTIANHIVLKEKTTKLNSQSAQYEKKNKINKDNSGKKIIKKEKNIMWGNTVAIQSVLKKKNYEAKFSTSSI